jgi:outer membrane lipoprotein-sorting protein
MIKRFLAAAAVLLVAGGLVAWLWSGPAALPIAFAEVQAAVKASGSVTFRQSTKIKGKVKETTTLLILANGIVRTEEEDGGYTITDPMKHRALLVRPKNKEAVLMEGLNTPSINLYELLKKLPGDAAARSLPRKKLDGKEVLGFTVPVPCDSGYCKGKELTLTVWADAGTRLPVRIETGDKDENGDAIEIIVDQIVFDKALDEKLFVLEPPEGYKMRSEGVANLPVPPADPKLKDLVVTLREGVGPVKFRMSREEVEKALGKADEAKEVGSIIQMNYGSRGLFIHVSKTRGVITIACSCQRLTLHRIRDFSGKTDKGVAMGASVADVVKAYGDPNRKDSNENNGGTTTLYYDKLNAWFTFLDDKLVEIFLSFPR